MKTIAIVSAKGGVGKTSFSANIGAALSRAGHPVLLVDLDPQNALCHHFGVAPDSSIGIAQATLRAQPWRTAAVATEAGPFILPYGQPDDTSRMAFEAAIETQLGWPRDQINAMQLRDDSIIIFDTPPGPSVYVRKILALADLALVVTLPDAASYAVLPIMERLIDEYSRPRPNFLGASYVINQTISNRALPRDVASLLKAGLGRRVMGQIHMDQFMRDALAKGQNVLEFAPYSQAAQDIQECAARLLPQLTNGTPQP